MTSEALATSGTVVGALVGLWCLDRALSTPGWLPPLVVAAAAVFLGDRLLAERDLRPALVPRRTS